METQNSTPEVSKSLGELWHQMSDEERQPYIERAKLAKIEHQKRYPDYKYKPIHPRDEFGNCIRKPRNPNRPRVNKKSAKSNSADYFDEEPLTESLPWLEGQLGITDSLPPPQTPSLPPSTPALISQNNFLSYSIPRRPSSVPLPMANNTAWSDLSQGAFPGAIGAQMQMGYYPSRRLSKRPSTSMDFINMPASHFQVQAPYALSNALGDQFPQQNNQHEHEQQHQAQHYLQQFHRPSMQWLLGHRRSLSAPNLGEFEAATAQLAQYPPLGNLPTTEANSLTPINPIFSNMFSNFTWSTAQDNQSSQQAALSGASSSSGIQIPKIPPMSNPPTSSNQSGFLLSASSTTQTPDRLIYHPAPVTTFKNYTVQNPVKNLETAAKFYHDRFDGLIPEVARAENVGFDNMLGLSVPDSLGAEVWAQRPQHQQQEELQQQQQQPLQQQQLQQQSGNYIDHQNHNGHMTHQIAPPRTLDLNELIVEGY